MATDEDSTNDPPVRDRLALTRTRLANERTGLAYARTSIMIAATGATLLKLYWHEPLSFAAGWLLVFVAVGVGIIGARRYRLLARRLR